MFSLNRINNIKVWKILNPLVRTAATAQTATKASGGYKFDNSRYGKNIVLIEGVRTPFTVSSTDYDGLLPYELQRMALR